jgi:hypothetical protein
MSFAYQGIYKQVRLKMPTAVHGPDTGEYLFRAGNHRQFHGTALFIDVRRSSQIVRHIERHHGSGSAAQFFMRYLTGCMEAVNRETDAKCQPSGDAVLAIIEGQDRISRAIKAATAAIRFVESTFEPKSQELLSCNGRCRHGYHRNGYRESHQPACRTMRFEVGVGVYDGVITESNLTSNYGDSQELVGSCVSLAAKLSGYRQRTNAIVLTRRTFCKATNRDELRDYRWHYRLMKAGGRYRRIMIACPPKL